MSYDGDIMMARTQITLDPETHRRARSRAAQLGMSLAAYFRRLVQQDLHESPRAVDPSMVFNLGRSEDADIARRKDQMVGEAVSEGRHQRHPSPR